MLLDGVRVLDLTQYLSGPAGTLLLAGLGADVIKVELGPGGDAARLLPFVHGSTSSYFVQQNRGKRSVCIDFTNPASHTLIADLAAEVDIVIENFGLGVLERRGLGYEDLRKRNPGLIMASISAFGRTGSRAHLPGYDLIGQSFAGNVAITGEPDGAPMASGAPIADVSAGMMAFGAIGHALFARERTGEGQYIDVSMVESVLNMHPFAVQGPSVTEGRARLKRNGRHFGSVPPAGTYRGPDDWLVIQVLDNQWSRLCDAASSIDLGADVRFATAQGRADHRHELVDTIEAWMQTFPSNQALIDHLDQHRVPCAPVIDPADVDDEPWFRERGAIVDVEDPTIGTIRVPGFPIHLSGQPDRDVEPPAPALGEHNADVLTELLGYDRTQIDSLIDAGVLISSTNQDETDQGEGQ